ncbi:hypothetical protein ACFE04_023724 [Oxalis oulophora]
MRKSSSKPNLDPSFGDNEPQSRNPIKETPQYGLSRNPLGPCQLIQRDRRGDCDNYKRDHLFPNLSRRPRSHVLVSLIDPMQAHKIETRVVPEASVHVWRESQW